MLVQEHPIPFVERVAGLMRIPALRHRRHRLRATLPRQTLQRPDRARLRHRQTAPTAGRERASRRSSSNIAASRTGRNSWGRKGSVGGGSCTDSSERTHMAVCGCTPCGCHPPSRPNGEPRASRSADRNVRARPRVRLASRISGRELSGPRFGWTPRRPWFRSDSPGIPAARELMAFRAFSSPGQVLQGREEVGLPSLASRRPRVRLRRGPLELQAKGQYDVRGTVQQPTLNAAATGFAGAGGGALFGKWA